MTAPLAADEALERRRMASLPDLAAQAVQAATAAAKFAADRAMTASTAEGRDAGSAALVHAEEGLRALIELETALVEERDLARMLRHIAAALRAAADASYVASEALEVTRRA